MVRWIKNRPILLKIFFVIFFCGAIGYFLIGGIFSSAAKSPKATLRKIIIGSSHYILEDLAEDPTLKKGKQLSQALMVQIRYEGLPQSWTTSESLPSYHQIKNSKESDFFRDHDHDRMKWNNVEDKRIPYNISFRRFHDQFYLILRDGNNRFIVKPNFDHELNLKRWLLALLLVLGGVFSLIYFLLKRILSPIKELDKGVKSVSEGNFELQLTSKSQDELGKLVIAFNHMTQQVKELLYSKEQLLLDVSHELRSPLTRAKVALELLPEGKNREGIKDDLNTMQQMLTELLESARLDSVHGGLNLSRQDIVVFTQSILKGYDDQGVGVLGTFPDNPVFIMGDVLRLEMLIKNIVENALKYSAPDCKPVQVELRQANGGVILTVKDSGSGIPKKDLPYILDPFYRVDKSRSKKTGGYGLGLSLCKKVVEAHQGKLIIESEVGIGSTVSIHLPLAQD
ncbi:MAG: HAMP domain-containing histidine kinase [Proteobacteria bacterium]|nr:HAMP domain-containing histidine kinase [Pseudomonadota bacterium]